MPSRLKSLKEREKRTTTPSDLLADLHIYILPVTKWIPFRRLARNHVVEETVSAGFVRVSPTSTLLELRNILAQQLDLDFPHHYVFIRSVGRNFTQVKKHQESLLKVKHFLPPHVTEPEIHILEVSEDLIKKSGSVPNLLLSDTDYSDHGALSALLTGRLSHVGSEAGDISRKSSHYLLSQSLTQDQARHELRRLEQERVRSHTIGGVPPPNMVSSQLHNGIIGTQNQADRTSDDEDSLTGDSYPDERITQKPNSRLSQRASPPKRKKAISESRLNHETQSSEDDINQTKVATRSKSEVIWFHGNQSKGDDIKQQGKRAIRSHSEANEFHGTQSSDNDANQTKVPTRSKSEVIRIHGNQSREGDIKQQGKRATRSHSGANEFHGTQSSDDDVNQTKVPTRSKSEVIRIHGNQNREDDIKHTKGATRSHSEAVEFHGTQSSDDDVNHTKMASRGKSGAIGFHGNQSRENDIKHSKRSTPSHSEAVEFHGTQSSGDEVNQTNNSSLGKSEAIGFHGNQSREDDIKQTKRAARSKSDANELHGTQSSDDDVNQTKTASRGKSGAIGFHGNQSREDDIKQTKRATRYKSEAIGYPPSSNDISYSNIRRATSLNVLNRPPLEAGEEEADKLGLGYKDRSRQRIKTNRRGHARSISVSAIEGNRPFTRNKGLNNSYPMTEKMRSKSQGDHQGYTPHKWRLQREAKILEKEVTNRTVPRESLQVVQKEREHLEDNRTELFNRARNLHEKILTIKERKRQKWWDDYNAARRKGTRLEERQANLRQELETLYRRVLGSLMRRQPLVTGVRDEPSRKASYKISVIRLRHEISDLLRRVEAIDIKLQAELRLRQQAEREVKQLRSEVSRKKANVALSQSRAPLLRNIANIPDDILIRL